MSTAEVTYQVRPYNECDEPSHCWTITENGVEVSALYVSLTTGMIVNIETLSTHRGQGHATRLYREASRTVEVLHSPSWARTDDGSRFAASVGGAIIDEATAEAFYGAQPTEDTDCGGCDNCAACCS